MRVRDYTEADGAAWDAFCAEAYGATFLHSRRFLSYHEGRFADRSVVIEDDQGRWLGLMPAAVSPANAALVVSHPGSTYGGIVHQGALRGEAMLGALRAVADHFVRLGHDGLQYKVVPHIYHRAPAQDDLYALFRLGARRQRCDLSSCIDLQGRLPLAERRRRAAKKAGKIGLQIRTGVAWAEPLWSVLEANLNARHGVRPTHTLAEILTLADRFPSEIEFVAALHDGVVVAGVVLFRGGPAVHAQYIASSPAGQEVAALDLVFGHCIDAASARGARYFDFGISTEAQGTVLNEGLYRFKSEFGASGVVHEFYMIELQRSST